MDFKGFFSFENVESCFVIRMGIFGGSVFLHFGIGGFNVEETRRLRPLVDGPGDVFRGQNNS